MTARLLTSKPADDEKLFEKWLALKDDHYVGVTKTYIEYCRENGYGPLEAYAFYFQDMDKNGFRKKAPKGKKGKKCAYAARTFNHHRNAVRNRIRWAFKQSDGIRDLLAGLQLAEYLDSVKRKKINSAAPAEEKVLSWDQVSKLVSECPSERMGLFIHFMALTGARITEVININNTDIKCNGENCSVRLRGKGSKERTVYVPKTLIDKINSVFHGEQWLFEHNGRPYNRTSVTARIAKAGRQVLGPDTRISAHALRHSYATHELEQHPDKLAGISKYLGHSQVATTVNIYLHGTLKAEDAIPTLDEPAPQYETPPDDEEREVLSALKTGIAEATTEFFKNPKSKPTR